MALRIGLAAITACILAAVALAGDAPRAPGDLDTTFGSGGRVGIALGGSDAQAFAAAVQADGKILLAGDVSEQSPPPPVPPPRPPLPTRPAADQGDFLAIRLTQNGTLDPSFGSGGIVRTPIDLIPDGADRLFGAALTPDGKLVVAGTSYDQGAEELSVVRYTEAGSLDPSFCGSGICTYGTQYGSGYAVAVQPDGKIVCAGELLATGAISVVRLLPNGDPDPSFGSDGMVQTVLGDPSDEDWGKAVLLQGDGRIVVGATADLHNSVDFSVVRYLSDGHLDPSFGSHGVVVTPAPNEQWTEAAALLPTGKIVVTGDSSYSGTAHEFRLARYNPDGSLDAGFGRGGIVTTRFHANVISTALAVGADGRVIAGGFDASTADIKYALARYNDDGSLDSGFGDGGTRTYDILAGATGDFGLALAIQQVDSGERLVQAGSSYDGAHYEVSAARLQLGPSGPPPAPPPPPPFVPPCVVPHVVGKPLAKARTKIRRAHCRVGRVRYKRAPLKKRGRVLSQQPRPGRHLANGAKVSLVVGRRR